MKILCFVLLVVLSLASAHAQGFIYDQQSADESTGGGAGITIQTSQPGQAFTPTLNSIGFIRLFLFDVNPNNGLGATVCVNLLSDSIAGPILASTDTASMPNGFGYGPGNGYIDFIFTTPATVAPGTTYFFQPVVQSGDSWAAVGYNYFYPGGTLFIQGTANSFNDLWFREGIIVPEPSSILFLVLGSGMLWFGRKKFVRR